MIILLIIKLNYQVLYIVYIYRYWKWNWNWNEWDWLTTYFSKKRFKEI